MTKNKVLFIAAVVLAGFSQSAHARFRFSWSLGAHFDFMAPILRVPVAGYFHVPAPRPVPVYHAPVVMPVVVPPVVHVAPVYHVPRPVMRYPHPRFHRRSMRGRVANFMRRGSWHVGVNFFA